MFGSHERWITDAYRELYISVDGLAAQMRRWLPAAGRILEVGCGEGAVTGRLAEAYPDAKIAAIDITPRLGRLYAGPPERVRFLQCTAQEIAGRGLAGPSCSAMRRAAPRPSPRRAGLAHGDPSDAVAGRVFMFKNGSGTPRRSTGSATLPIMA